MEGVFIMAQLSTSVTTAELPRVGICAVTLPKTGPTIHMLNVDGGTLVAYDRDTWTPAQIDGWVRIYLGDYELVEPATGRA